MQISLVPRRSLPLTRFGPKFKDVTEWSAATQTGSQALAATLRSL